MTGLFFHGLLNGRIDNLDLTNILFVIPLNAIYQFLKIMAYANKFVVDLFNVIFEDIRGIFHHPCSGPTGCAKLFGKKEINCLGACHGLVR